MAGCPQSVFEGAVSGNLYLSPALRAFPILATARGNVAVFGGALFGPRSCCFPRNEVDRSANGAGPALLSVTMLATFHQTEPSGRTIDNAGDKHVRESCVHRPNLGGHSLATALTILLAPGASADHAPFTVVATFDAHDDVPGDGICKSPDLFLIPPFGSGTIPGTCTLRAAVEEANAHAGPDTVALAAETYTLSIGSLGVISALTIVGEGLRLTVIDALQASRAFVVDATGNLEIANLMVTGGLAAGGAGGAIWNGGRLTVRNSRVSNNKSVGTGGAIRNGNLASLTLIASTISSNRSDTDGGGVWNSGTLTMTSSTVSNNSAAANGGGIWNQGGAFMTDTVVTSNVTTNGGGVYNESGTLTLTRSTVTDNTAFVLGGGIVNLATLELTTASAVSDNAADIGGGVWNQGTTTLTDSTLNDNDAATFGGGLVNSFGILTLTNTRVSDNSAPFGGGVVNAGDGTLTLADTVISGNVAQTAFGGGIFNDSPKVLTLTNTLISGNVAQGDGGGIWNELGAVELTNSTVSGNVTQAGDGGGMWNTGHIVRLSGSTVSGNAAAADGGGIWNRGTLTLTNSTVSGNNAAARGGGVFNGMGGVLTVLNATISANIAGSEGGGIAQRGATATLQSAIVAGNAATDCDGLVVSLDNNLDGDNTCKLIAVNDVPGAVPLLGVLANNGGSTETHALLTGSPAIDAGSPIGAPTTDQRGFPRVGVPDIGAYELQPVDADGDGFFSVETGGTDCDDANAAVRPGSTDTPYDGVDQDCDGEDLVDADGDGYPALQATGGTPDCDDTIPAIHPGAIDVAGDDIDQDCDGTDASVEVAQTLIAGWNTLVYMGDNAASPDTIVAAIGPRLASLWLFQPALQTWLVHRPGALPILNTLVQVSPGDALFVLLLPGDPLSVTLPDTLTATPVAILLLPGWTFVGYTGVDGALPADLIGGSQSIDALFAFHSPTQLWNGFFPGQPAFLNALAAIDRGMALFVHSTGADPITLTWDQVALSP